MIGCIICLSNSLIHNFCFELRIAAQNNCVKQVALFVPAFTFISEEFNIDGTQRGRETFQPIPESLILEV